MIISNGLFTSLGVNKSSSLTVLVDFKKLRVVFNLNTLLFKSFLDESISRVTIMNELFIGIHNSEGVLGGESTIGGSPVPNLVGNEEIETFNFTSIRIFRNAEETVTTLEVGDIFRVFVLTSSPRIGVLVGIDGVFRMFKSIIESLNLREVVLNTSSKN